MARLIGYSLLLLLIAFGVGVYLYGKWNTPENRYKRRSRREQRAYEELMRDKNEDHTGGI